LRKIHSWCLILGEDLELARLDLFYEDFNWKLEIFIRSSGNCRKELGTLSLLLRHIESFLQGFGEKVLVQITDPNETRNWSLEEGS